MNWVKSYFQSIKQIKDYFLNQSIFLIKQLNQGFQAILKSVKSILFKNKMMAYFLYKVFDLIALEYNLSPLAIQELRLIFEKACHSSFFLFPRVKTNMDFDSESLTLKKKLFKTKIRISQLKNSYKKLERFKESILRILKRFVSPNLEKDSSLKEILKSLQNHLEIMLRLETLRKNEDLKNKVILHKLTMEKKRLKFQLKISPQNTAIFSQTNLNRSNVLINKINSPELVKQNSLVFNPQNSIEKFDTLQRNIVNIDEELQDSLEEYSPSKPSIKYETLSNKKNRDNLFKDIFENNIF